MLFQYSLVLLLACCLATAAYGQPAPKLAVVIGNAEYAISPLHNPVNDADDLTRQLTGIGFKVDTVRNGGRAAMLAAVQRHAAQLNQQTLSVFYFAGHGMQLGGRNFLVPVDLKLNKADDILTQGVSIDEIIAIIAKAKPRYQVLILDACRDNPFGEGTLPGLAPLDAPVNTLIAFATAPGKTAEDGRGKNGLYTSHLLRHMGGGDKRVEEVFKLVRVGVLEDSAGRQLPWENTALTGELGFAAFPNGIASPSAVDVDVPGWVASASDRDLRSYLTQNSDARLRQPITARLMQLRAQAPIRTAALALSEQPCPACPRMTAVELPADSAQGLAKQTLWLGTDLTTAADWQRCVAAKSCAPLADAPRVGSPEAAWMPASGVSWKEAQRYLAWLNQQAGTDSMKWSYRLPTQNEWQRVYRSGYFDERGKPIFESQSACRYANLYDQNGALVNRFDWPNLPCLDGFAEASPVGFFLPSGHGVFDLIGNLWQWTSSCAQPEPSGVGCRRQRLVGGSWATGKNWSWEQPPTLAAEADLGAPIFGLRVVATRQP